MPRALSKVYFDPLTPENRAEMNKLFRAIAGDDVVTDRTLSIWGRKLHVPESAGRVARFSFQDLCGKPLSAADYLEVTREFETIFVTDVPSMNLGQKDMARRFITFIDGMFLAPGLCPRNRLSGAALFLACYESKTKLFISSEAPITRIFSGDSESTEISDHQRGVMDDLVCLAGCSTA
jgi:protein AFG1